MKDLTILFLTVNKVPEKWANYHRSVLLKAIGDTPIISISRKPMDLGFNLIQDSEPSVSNIYQQILRGAKIATTPYIAIVEDDCLYSKEHFLSRPPLDAFGYDMNRWGLFTWGKPTFYHKARISNGAMIAPRELVIKALEERCRMYPNFNSIGELGKEKGTRLSYRNRIIRFWPTVSMIFISHVDSIDPLEQTKKKRMSMVRAYKIPYWGKAQDIISRWI